MNIITSKQLKKLNASKDQLTLFKQLFGEQLIVTEEACIAIAQEFDWHWAANNLLTVSNIENYLNFIIPHNKVYNDIIQTNSLIYKEATKVYRDKRWKQTADPKMPKNKIKLIYKEYHEAVAPYVKIYKEATEPHLETYNVVRATAFAQCYLDQ